MNKLMANCDLCEQCVNLCEPGQKMGKKRTRKETKKTPTKAKQKKIQPNKPKTTKKPKQTTKNQQC